MSTTFVLILAAIALIISLWAIAKTFKLTPFFREDTFNKVLKTKKLIIGYVQWPPSVIKDPLSGKLSGFLIEAIRDIVEDAGLSLEYIESSWGGFTEDLRAGKFDVAVAGLSPLIIRSTTVSFTRPFYFAGNNGVVKADDTRFKSLADLNRPDIKIAVLEKELSHIYAQKYFPQAQLVVLEKTADNTAPLAAVSAGQADTGLIMEDVVEEYVKVHPEVKKLSPFSYFITPLAWAVRKSDQQLLNFLENAINYLEATGKLEVLAKKYNSTWRILKKEYQHLSK